MMHAREKSDSAIVAGKPTNKAERSAAEPVEPRAETKGNANQQSTHRTQSRASVTQALERVRKAASKRKKEKFTALIHRIMRAAPGSESIREPEEISLVDRVEHRRRCAGRQDRSAGGDGGAQRDLRGRFPRVLVWIPTRARRA